MLRERRPWYVKRAIDTFHDRYAQRFLSPHFSSVGEGFQVRNPWAVYVFGPHITAGRRVQITAAFARPVTIANWTGDGITLGDYSLLQPGVRISSATRVTIGANAILAADVYITDCDWHGTYDRLWSAGKRAPVTLKRNVWVSERAIICRGVTIGENSIVGAASIVTRDVPDNVVVAGNPARVVRELDPTCEFVSREHFFTESEALYHSLRRTEREMLAENSLLDWLRYVVRPRRGD